MGNQWSYRQRSRNRSRENFTRASVRRQICKTFKMNLVYCIFLCIVITAGQAFPHYQDNKFDEKFCEIKLYSTTVPRDHALSYTLPQDTKTRIRGRVHSFWLLQVKSILNLHYLLFLLLIFTQLYKQIKNIYIINKIILTCLSKTSYIIIYITCSMNIFNSRASAKVVFRQKDPMKLGIMNLFINIF